MKQAMVELHLWDWLVIGLYGVAMFAIAWWAMRSIKDVGGFVLGKRKVGKLLMLAGSLAGGTSANHPMAIAAATYKEGWSGLWLSLTWILMTPFFWMYPPLFRRMRIVTMVDFVQLRYGKIMANIFKWSGLITMPISMGLGVKAAAIVVEVMTGGQISGNWAIAVILVPTVLYTIMGGLVAAMATDLLQGLMIVVLSFLIIPFAVHAAGGLAPLDAAIEDRLTMLIAQTDGQGFGPWWIFWFLVSAIFAGASYSGGSGAAAKNEMSARFLVFGSVIKRFCTLGWGLIGLMGIALVSGLEKPGDVFPVMSGMYLPVVLRGLMAACILAAVMSSIDVGLVAWSGMLVQNVYREHLVKSASAAHYLAITRLGTVLACVFTWYFALTKLDLVVFMTIVEPLGSLTGVAILGCLMWRRVTKWGAIASVAVMTPLFIFVHKWHLTTGLDALPWGIQHVCIWMQQGYAALNFRPLIPTGPDALLPLEFRIPLYLLPGLISLVVVSLLTRQHNARDVEQFYARLDTPVGEEEKLRDRGFKVDDLEGIDEEMVKIDPKDHDLSRRFLLVDLLYLPWLLVTKRTKLSDYKWDWIGLAGSAVFIYLFLKFAIWLGSLL